MQATISTKPHATARQVELWEPLVGGRPLLCAQRRLPLAEPAVCKRASAVRLKRKETALGVASFFSYCEFAGALLFVFFLGLHTAVFVRSFQITKHNHFNVS